MNGGPQVTGLNDHVVLYEKLPVERTAVFFRIS